MLLYYGIIFEKNMIHGFSRQDQFQANVPISRPLLLTGAIRYNDCMESFFWEKLTALYIFSQSFHKNNQLIKMYCKEKVL